MRLPGVRGGQEVDELVEEIDLVPTILDAVGITSNAAISGRSFYEPLTTGSPIPAEVGIAELPAKKMYAVRSGDWKLIESPAKVELYDLSRDPLETRNLASERPDQVDRLKGELQSMLKSHPPAAEGTRPVGQTELETLKALGYIK
jgi:arylsulfatase A-like enzyme